MFCQWTDYICGQHTAPRGERIFPLWQTTVTSPLIPDEKGREIPTTRVIIVSQMRIIRSINTTSFFPNRGPFHRYFPPKKSTAMDQLAPASLCQHLAIILRIRRQLQQLRWTAWAQKPKRPWRTLTDQGHSTPQHPRPEHPKLEPTEQEHSKPEQTRRQTEQGRSRQRTWRRKTELGRPEQKEQEPLHHWRSCCCWPTTTTTRCSHRTSRHHSIPLGQAWRKCSALERSTCRS